MKTFNTTAVCIPSKHYMVDLSQRVEEIKRLVDDGKYFTINCARQYGKTTTLNALEQYLSKAYDVLSIDFQDMTASDFADESEFVKGMAQIFCNCGADSRIYRRLSVFGKQALPNNSRETCSGGVLIRYGGLDRMWRG